MITRLTHQESNKPTRKCAVDYYTTYCISAIRDGRIAFGGATWQVMFEKKYWLIE